MYGVRRRYVDLYRGRRESVTESAVEPSGLERVAAETRGLRVVVREVEAGMPEVVAYPWVCFACGSHMRHGDVCAFCGNPGRRVVQRRGSGAASTGQRGFANDGRSGQSGR